MWQGRIKSWSFWNFHQFCATIIIIIKLQLCHSLCSLSSSYWYIYEDFVTITINNYTVIRDIIAKIYATGYGGSLFSHHHPSVKKLYTFKWTLTTATAQPFHSPEFVYHDMRRCSSVGFILAQRRRRRASMNSTPCYNNYNYKVRSLTTQLTDTLVDRGSG